MQYQPIEMLHGLPLEYLSVRYLLNNCCLFRFLSINTVRFVAFVDVLQYIRQVFLFLTEGKRWRRFLAR